MSEGPKIPCPNCGNDTFISTLDSSNPAAVLVSAKIEKNGSYTPDFSKVMGVTPYVCTSCNYIMLFRNN